VLFRSFVDITHKSTQSLLHCTAPDKTRTIISISRLIDLKINVDELYIDLDSLAS